MGARINLAESNGRQKPAAQSKFRFYIIKIGAKLDFWRAALRITPSFLPGGRPPAQTLIAGWHFQPLRRVVRSAVAANRDTLSGIL